MAGVSAGLFPEKGERGDRNHRYGNKRGCFNEVGDNQQAECKYESSARSRSRNIRTDAQKQWTDEEIRHYCQWPNSPVLLGIHKKHIVQKIAADQRDSKAAKRDSKQH